MRRIDEETDIAMRASEYWREAEFADLLGAVRLASPGLVATAQAALRNLNTRSGLSRYIAAGYAVFALLNNLYLARAREDYEKEKQDVQGEAGDVGDGDGALGPAPAQAQPALHGGDGGAGAIPPGGGDVRTAGVPGSVRHGSAGA